MTPLGLLGRKTSTQTNKSHEALRLITMIILHTSNATKFVLVYIHYVVTEYHNGHVLVLDCQQDLKLTIYSVYKYAMGRKIILCHSYNDDIPKFNYRILPIENATYAEICNFVQPFQK